MIDARLRSKWWRINHLYKILDKNGNLVTFKPNYVQKLILAMSAGLLRVLILKARQFGITTLFCIDMLDDACFVPGSTNAIIAHEREAVDKIFEIVKRAYESMPPEVRPAARRDTLRALKFDTRFDGVQLTSEIYVALKVRSTTVRRLHITESAYIKNRQELEAGSKQAVPKDGRITEETTGNGYGAFYDVFMRAYQNQQPGLFDNHAFFFPWFLDPNYSLPGILTDVTADELALRETAKRDWSIDLTDEQLLWRRWKMRDLVGQGDLQSLTPEQLFKQEYPSSVMEAFQSGVGNVFDNEKVERAAQHVRQPLRVEDGLTVWLEPVPGGRYVIGGDPSDGGTGDPGVIDVWDIESLEQVAQWAGHLRPDQLAKKAAQMGSTYNNAYVGIENNMLSTVLFLVQVEKYGNYHMTVKVDERTKKKTEKLGWTTTSQSRDLMIDDFLIDFDDDNLKINSLLTLDQMSTFVKKDSGKREHTDGKHDDALFAGMIANQMRKFYRGPAKLEDIDEAGNYDDWSASDI